MRFVRIGLAIIVSSMVMFLAVASFGVLSNPVVPDASEIDTTFRILDPKAGIATLMVINVLVNLFWICVLLLYLGKRFGATAMVVPRTGSAFVLRVFFMALFVTVVGAFVDYLLVMGINPDYSEDYRVMVFDPLSWSVAVALIFLSVISSAYIFMEMAAKPLFIVAGVITLLNPVWWVLTGLLGNNVLMVTIILSALILPIALKGLLDLHGSLRCAMVAQHAAERRASQGAK